MLFNGKLESSNNRSIDSKLSGVFQFLSSFFFPRWIHQRILHISDPYISRFEVNQFLLVAGVRCASCQWPWTHRWSCDTQALSHSISIRHTGNQQYKSSNEMSANKLEGYRRKSGVDSWHQLAVDQLLLQNFVWANHQKEWLQSDADG